MEKKNETGLSRDIEDISESTEKVSPFKEGVIEGD